MIIGMLWFDNDKKRTLAEKVARAAEYYAAKYGIDPDVCFINERVEVGGADTNGVILRPVRYVVAGHFWIGVSDE